MPVPSRIAEPDRRARRVRAGRRGSGHVRSARVAVVALVALVALGLLAACGPADGAGAPAPPTTARGPDDPDVVLFGDSLSVEAGDYLTQLLEPDHTVRVVAFGGLALCDLADQVVATAREDAPALLLVQFSGNALSPCMRPDGEDLGRGEVIERYRRDAERLVDDLAPTGVRLVLVGSPPGPHEPDPDATTNAVFEQVAEDARADGRAVAYADAGSALEAFGATWTAELPCLPFETVAMGCRDGSIEVRSADGVHFCPAATASEDGVVGRCETWSSGAFRYARSVADVVRARLGARPE